MLKYQLHQVEFEEWRLVSSVCDSLVTLMVTHSLTHSLAVRLANESQECPGPLAN